MWDFVGFGALNWDLIYELPDISPLVKKLNISLKTGEEIHLEEKRLLPAIEFLEQYGIKKSESSGGQAANTAYALMRMGFKTKIFGKAGIDKWGDMILQGLSGVDTSAVKREGSSGICISILTPGGDRTMIVFPGVNNRLDDLIIEKDDLFNIASSRFLHLTSFASADALKIQIDIVNILQDFERGVLITFDPGSLYAGFGLNALMPIIKKTYCLFATKSEIEIMTNLPSEMGAERMFELGVQNVICKQGSRGAYLLNNRGRRDFPPIQVEVRDPTGAGDCFAAGFLAGLLKGFDLDICGQIGTRAASASISGYGRESYPDEDIL